ncbi:MAG: hypothetical protein WCH39_16290, partial [Schlesneria sp.]
MNETNSVPSKRLIDESGIMIGTSATAADAGTEPRFPVPTDAETWQRLPTATKGSGQALPSWAKMLAAELPKTAAAFLELDLAQRTKSPVAPGLRGAMRWISAHANRCDYAEAYAAADARRAGVDDVHITALGRDGYPGWSNDDRAALEFARKMSVDSDSVTDDEFAGLVNHFGQKQAASMVLLLAYSNFQDRFLLCLNAPLEPGGPLPPIDVAFAPESYVTKTTPPPPLKTSPLPKPTGMDLVEDDPEWKLLSYEKLQER